MEKFKQSLTKGITALNVKTNNFMEESKCKTYISTLEKEILDLKLAVGEKVYEKWTLGESAAEETEELLKSIQTKYEEIQAQKEKMEKLQQEEQQILGTSGANPAQTQEEEFIFCSQCGTRNAANYKFCRKCGAALSND